MASRTQDKNEQLARKPRRQEKLRAADLADMADELEPECGAANELRQSILSASAIRLHFQTEATAEGAA